eukprot:TRINITY_DN2133_c0_g2_i1.p3 TRINITY_DN2133_c0_g2~~TRINITY_DN2133_c0_g2_i1.p3  ORF type:complete len:130 (+),score=1.97 TRINITY_DN2133_c0_g2_i1:87-476(+)
MPPRHREVQKVWVPNQVISVLFVIDCFDIFFKENVCNNNNNRILLKLRAQRAEIFFENQVNFMKISIIIVKILSQQFVFIYFLKNYQSIENKIFLVLSNYSRLFLTSLLQTSQKILNLQTHANKLIILL